MNPFHLAWSGATASARVTESSSAQFGSKRARLSESSELSKGNLGDGNSEKRRTNSRTAKIAHGNSLNSPLIAMQTRGGMRVAMRRAPMRERNEEESGEVSVESGGGGDKGARGWVTSGVVRER